MKTRKIIFFAVLVAMVLALTGCGLPSDLQGVYAPAKVVVTQPGHATITETIDWNNGTWSSNESGVDYYVETYAYWYGKVFNVSGSKAQTAQPITSVAGGIDGITWYDADSDEDVEVEGDNVVIGDWLINYTFEPSDLDDYRFVRTVTVSSSNKTIKLYYNIY